MRRSFVDRPFRRVVSSERTRRHPYRPRLRSGGEGAMRLGSLGPVELLLIVLAIVLIFGASKLGDLGGALGKSVKEFKKATRDEEAEAAAKQQATIAPPSASSAEPPSPTATTQAAQPATAVGVGDYRPPDAAPPT